MQNMKIFEITNRTTAITKELLDIWENSVKATHLFLSNKDIQNIKICTRSSKRSETFNNHRKRKQYTSRFYGNRKYKT